MHKTGIILILLAVMTGCLNEEEDIQLSETEFNGTFMRVSPGISGEESPVRLTLQSGTYSGMADSLYYPAICQGNYSIEGNRITFTNDCGWTANFDWSYILQGTYIIEENRDETVFIQEVRDNEFNVYRLQKSP